MTTPSELAKAVMDIVEKAQARVGPESIGAMQYYVEGQPQKFETMYMDEFLDYMEEEALDIINYGVMLCLKIHAAKYGVDKLSEEPECREPHFISLNLGWEYCSLIKNHEGKHSWEDRK